MAAVLANRRRSAAEIVEALLASVQGFAAGAPQSDDLTLVVVKIAS